MAEVGHRHFKSDTTANTTSSTPVTAYTLGTLGQIPAGDYMVLGTALFGATAGGASNNARRVELHDNGTLIDADTLSRLQPEVAADGVGHPYGILRRFTKNASGSVTFEVYNTDSINVAVMCCEAVFYNLDDMVEGTDFLFAEVTADDLNPGASYSDGASITLPAGASEKWVIFSLVRWDSATVGEDSLVRIVDDAANLVEIQSDNNDINDLQCMLTSYPINGAASTKTVKVQYRASSTTNDVRYSALFALRLGTFKYGDFALGGTATVIAADSFVEAESLDFTATHTGEHCVMGSAIFGVADTANRRERQITSEVGGGGETVIAGSATRQIVHNASSDLLPAFMCAGVSYTVSDSVDLDLDVGDDINNTNESVSEAWLACHSWELAAAGGSLPVFRRRRE